VVAVAALLAVSAGAVMAFGRESSSPVAAPPATTPTSSPSSTTSTAEATTTAPTRAVPTTTGPTAAPKPSTPARRTTPPRATARVAAPTPVKAAPSPKTPAPRTTSTPKPSPKPSPKPVATSSGVAAQVLSLVNAERLKAGCRSLASSSALQQAAQGHSVDMAANDYFSHTSEDGRSFSDRIRAAGYTGGGIAENIAAGQATASAVMTSWMNSPGHRANILNCAYRYLGVGFAKGGSYGSYWTQDFGG
jgi:uncharacterized protein YkwD